MVKWFQRALPWGLGFFLVANATLYDTGGASLRATDLIALMLAAMLVLRWGVSVSWMPVSLAVAVVFLPLAWTGLALLGIVDRGTLAQGIRWVFAVPWALVMLSIASDEPGRTRLIKGITIGCILNAVVVAAQQYGFEGPFARLGFSRFGENIVWVGEMVRMPGMHGSPSASAAVISLVAPASLWLYLRGRASILWPLVGFAAAAVGLHLTASRSPLLMLALTTLVALTVTISRPRALLLWALGLGVALPLLVIVGPPGGWVRWTDTGDTTVNASNRLHTNASAFELTLQHPLGMGVDEGQRAMFEETGYLATHNAWLQAGLSFGAPFALAILLGALAALSRVRHGWKSDAFWPALVAFHLCGLFLFEDHLNNPTFVILSMWVVLVAVARRRRAPVPQSMRAS